MGKQRLTTFVLALKNLGKHSFRTKCLIVIVAFFAFTVFCGALLSQSINLGVNYMSGRMGADIMVVPRGCAPALEDTLLRSKSNTFYFNEDLTQAIDKMQGVERVSPQLYTASLNAACCTVPIQMIAFDPGTDFTIRSWMTNINSSELGFNEVVTGSLIKTNIGEQIWLFGQPLTVAATLNDTGMGFDSSIFMTMQTAQNIIENSKETAVQPAGNGKDLISALFIKLNDGSDASAVAKSIINQYPQTDAVISQVMMKNVSSQLNQISGLIYAIQGLIWIVSIFILAVVFTVTANERRREFGLYLALGAARKKILKLIMTENLIISVSGAFFGILAGCLLMFEFLMLIATSLGLPYLKPAITTTAALIFTSLLIAVITGMAAGIYSAVRIGKSEMYLTIKGNE